MLTFVRAGVAQHAPAFADAGIELTVCRTGEDVFNEIGFTDPFGHAVAVIEARTYSPVERGESEPSLCGDFAEVQPAGHRLRRRAALLGSPRLRGGRRGAGGPVPAPAAHQRSPGRLASTARAWMSARCWCSAILTWPRELRGYANAACNSPRCRATGSTAALIEGPGGLPLLLADAD